MEEEVSPEEIEIGLAIQGALERAEARQAELQAQLARANDLQKRLARSLAALTATGQGNPRPRQRNRSGTRVAPSKEMQDKVLGAIRQLGGQSTVRQLREQTGVAKSTVDYTVRYLRDQHRIRKAGVGGQTGSAYIYKLMNGGNNGA